MKNLYHHSERRFERVASIAISVLGNSITFIFAIILVLFWLTNEQFFQQDMHYRVGDIILGVTFLSLFIIQKSFNRFSASLHVKLNELLASHEPASNAVLNAEGRTEHELNQLSKGYADLADQALENEKTSNNL
jgi:low affinity Fe/Cu permease